jgi:hypothetical protein
MSYNGSGRPSIYTGIQVNDDYTEAVVKITVKDHKDGIEVRKARITLKEGKIVLEPFGEIEFEKDDDTQ